jgi:hypothetical protein
MRQASGQALRQASGQSMRQPFETGSNEEASNRHIHSSDDFNLHGMQQQLQYALDSEMLQSEAYEMRQVRQPEATATEQIEPATGQMEQVRQPEVTATGQMASATSKSANDLQQQRQSPSQKLYSD